MKILFAAVAATLVASPAIAQVVATPTVGSGVEISVGTIASEIFSWLIVAFGSVISAAMVAGVVKLFQFFGVQIDEKRRAKLQGIILNGLNAAAAKSRTGFQGLGTVEIKNQITADAVQYVKQHGADTIKKLGLDPTSGEAVEAIRAHIETLIADGTKPTPPEITPPTVTVAAAAITAPLPAEVKP